MKKFNIEIKSRVARLTLHAMMSLTTVVGVAVLISYLRECNAAPATAAYIHRPMLEYLLASTVISVCGALLVDAVASENAKK